MNSLKIYATGSATANAVAQVIIPKASTIKGIQIAFALDSATDNGAFNMELSRASAREVAVNGAQQCICEVTQYGNFVTSGLNATGVNVFLPVDVPVTQGQIIYLHAAILSGGAATYYFTGIIWYV